MKLQLFITGIAGIILINNSAFSATCRPDVTTTANIPNGTMTTTQHAYYNPLCVMECPCSQYRTTYSCICDSGYFAPPAGLNTKCRCVQCPVANSTCTSATSFRCNAGYYKNEDSCTACPNGGTSAAGATSITSCYLPSGTTGTDSSGTYTYTLNCYYTN